MNKITVGSRGARAKFKEWLEERGGVAIWTNQDLSNPGAGEIFTPALDMGGYPSPAPRWSHPGPAIIANDLKPFRFVDHWDEVKRFHVALRRSGNGISIKLTDGSTRKVRNACDKFPGSSYRFDYETQEAVIEVPVWEEDANE